MIRFSFSMLFVSLILLFVNPASVFATTTTPAGPACTNGLVPCGSGCYEPAVGDVCCSNASTSWACPAESAATNSPAIPSLFSTTSVTSMTTQTVTLGSATPGDSNTADSSLSGVPGYSTLNHPSATTGASCVPTTVTVTSVSISYLPPASSDVNNSTSASSFSNTISENQTALTSITVQTSSETSVTSTIVTSQTRSTDVAATTTPAPTTPTTPATTSSPGQPVTSYTPGNDSADIRLPSIFGLYIILVGLAFI